MKVILDESRADFAKIMEELRIMTPGVLGYSDRHLILPRKLGDLDKPEILENIKNKVQNLKQLQDLFCAGQISPAEYDSKKAEILSSK